MQKLTLWIPCTPPKATSQMKGMARCAGRVHFYKKDSVAMAERSFLVHLKGNMPADWKKIEEGPIQLDVSFVWPWRQTETKSNMEWPLLHMDVKPDCSNIIKLLEDCMTNVGVWRDDAQVADLRIRKFWGEEPGIRIVVQPITKYEDGAV